jgi:hypothetical protein
MSEDHHKHKENKHDRAQDGEYREPIRSILECQIMSQPIRPKADLHSSQDKCKVHCHRGDGRQVRVEQLSISLVLGPVTAEEVATLDGVDFIQTGQTQFTEFVALIYPAGICRVVIQQILHKAPPLGPSQTCWKEVA